MSKSERKSPTWVRSRLLRCNSLACYLLRHWFLPWVQIRACQNLHIHIHEWINEFVDWFVVIKKISIEKFDVYYYHFLLNGHGSWTGNWNWNYLQTSIIIKYTVRLKKNSEKVIIGRIPERNLVFPQTVNYR